MKMCMSNDLRSWTCERLLDATFRERELRFEQREHALALRILRRELGEDALTRIAALPPGWLPFANHQIRFKTRTTHGVHRYPTEATSLTLANAMPVPAFVSHNQLEVGPTSVAEVEVFCADAALLVDERELLKKQVLGTLAGFYTVEALATGWPEGYAYFPVPELAPETLPAHRIEDLNARLAAAREAA